MNCFFSVNIFLSRFFLCIFLTWTIGFASSSVYIDQMHPPKPLDPTKGIVVFTGEKGRIEQGHALYKKGKGHFFHISGTNKKRNITSCISHDNAVNTFENIQLTLEWMNIHHIRSVRLVTSDYHMPRCLSLANHFWKGIDVIAHPLRLNMKSPQRIKKILIEYHKWIYAQLKIVFWHIKAML